MKPDKSNLRERQRNEVWRSIHDAAASLLLEHGWTVTTTDMIAQKAGISTRTFFNYFPTKEDAALGFRPHQLTAEALEEFNQSSADLFDRAVRLTMAVIRSGSPDDDLRERRAKLISTLPELHPRLNHYATAASELIEPVLVGELTTKHQDSLAVDTEEIHDEARVLRMLAGTVIRFALNKDPAALSSTPTDTLTRAIATFREVMKYSL